MTTNIDSSLRSSEENAPSSSGNASNNSGGKWLSPLMEKWGKIQLADHLRLMADNQRTLDMVAATEREDRQLDAAINRRMAGEAATPIDFGGKSDDMKISIDSPETKNVYYQVPPPGAASTIAKWALIAAGLTGAGSGAAYVASKIPSITDTDTKYELRLVDDTPSDTPIAVPADE